MQRVAVALWAHRVLLVGLAPLLEIPWRRSLREASGCSPCFPDAAHPFGPLDVAWHPGEVEHVKCLVEVPAVKRRRSRSYHVLEVCVLWGLGWGRGGQRGRHEGTAWGSRGAGSPWLGDGELLAPLAQFLSSVEPLPPLAPLPPFLLASDASHRRGMLHRASLPGFAETLFAVLLVLFE